MLTSPDPSDRLEGQRSPRLRDARIFILFDVTGKVSARRFGAQVASDGEVEDTSLMSRFLTKDLGWGRVVKFGDHRLVHISREAGGAFWQNVPGGLALAKDLHPQVIAAFGGPMHGTGPTTIPALELTQLGRNVINGRYARPKAHWSDSDTLQFDASESGLSLTLSQAARRRLGTEADELRLEVVGGIAVFPSSFAVVAVELSIDGPSDIVNNPIAIEEALHILSNRSRKDASTLAVFKDRTPASLSEIVHVALPWESADETPWQRIFSYSIQVLDKFHSDQKLLEEMAFRCARHYTQDYRLNIEEVEKALFRPFNSVIHAFSLEGVSSVVDGSDAFLGEQFLTKARQLYLWLIVLAYHEQVYLLDILNAEMPPNSATVARDDALARLIERFLEFRLRHRLPLVSDVEMHNEVYRMLRRALRLVELVEKIANDTVEAKHALSERVSDLRRRITRRRQEQRQRSLRQESWMLGLLMFGLTFLSFDALTRRVEDLLDLSHKSRWIGILIPLAFGLLGGGLRFRQSRRDANEEVVEDRVWEEGLNAAAESVEVTAVAAGAAGAAATHSRNI